MKESLSVRALDQRLRNVAGQDQILAYRLRVTVANVVVGQMLPPGVVKGGTAMKIRLGESGSRFTPDLDIPPAGNRSHSSSKPSRTAWPQGGKASPGG